MTVSTIPKTCCWFIVRSKDLEPKTKESFKNWPAKQSTISRGLAAFLTQQYTIKFCDPEKEKAEKKNTQHKIH